MCNIYITYASICLSKGNHVSIVYAGPLPIPLTALPVAVGDAHHDEDDREEEEDEAGEAVDDGGGGRDGDGGLRHHGDTWQPETISIQRGSASFLLSKFLSLDPTTIAIYKSLIADVQIFFGDLEYLEGLILLKEWVVWQTESY